MKYSWKQGVDRHPEALSRSLLVGLPIVLAVLVLGPMKLGNNPATHPTTSSHSTSTAIKQPFNLRYSGNKPTGSGSQSSPPAPAATNVAATPSSNTSSPSTSGSPTGSSSSPSSSSTIPTSGGRGGGSPVDTGSAATPSPTATVSIPGQTVTVGDKPIISTDSLSLTIN